MQRAGSALIFAALAQACLGQDQITRLRPRNFPELPPNLIVALDRRGCAIPQVPMISGRHNVMKGEFAKPGQTDWAVLCSVNASSSILVFWNGSAINPAQIENREDAISVQGWTSTLMAYSRDIGAVDKPFIVDHYEAYKSFGAEKPPPIDHQGINDDFYGKASTVLYFYRGKWLHLAGSD